MSYPYDSGKEVSFIEPEIKILKKNFEIILVPSRISGFKHKVPAGIKVIESYSKIYNQNNFLLLVKIILLSFNFNFFLQIAKKPVLFFNFFNLKKLISSFIRRIDLLKWLDNNRKILINHNSILYSYWFDAHTSAILDFKKKHFGIKVVTRAHGTDLYENKFIPFRSEAIGEIDKIFLISKYGFEYLSKKYPQHKKKFNFSPLGIKDQNITVRKSRGNTFRIVSCSFVLPVKRVEFIADTIKILATISKKKIEWFHIGDGEKLNIIKKNMTNVMPSNKLETFFLGDISNKEVFNFYKSQRLDLFLLLSLSEGRPIAILEAINVGLPIVATNVGGVKELISEKKNGLLVNVYDKPIKIAHKINSIIDNPRLLKFMSKESKVKWKKVGNFETNHKQLAKQLNLLINK
jgi:glycosyltransferase involved in cell wall biosynthesis